ncbi:hypothetical protein SLS62_008541 [Diatrype stigma]|uniref:Uncharacterized protein n=1 Tax=Diatrype stigma TaxID=117547 RepID=A0AAN9UK16_9PEZI
MDHHSRAGHSTSSNLPVFALAAGLTAVGLQYGRTTLRRNEQAQRDVAPNLYVSVDRSGGGI